MIGTPRLRAVHGVAPWALTRAGAVPIWPEDASFETDRFMRGKRSKNGSGAQSFSRRSVQLLPGGPQGSIRSVALLRPIWSWSRVTTLP